MPFKGISYLELWQPSFSAERNHLCNFVRWYPDEKFCEITLNLGPWFRGCLLKDFLSGALATLLFSGAYHLCNFERWHHGDHSSYMKLGPVVQENVV